MKPLAVLLMLAGALAAAPIPKSLKKPKLNLNGVWEAISVSVSGVDYPIEPSKPWKIEGENMTFDWKNTANKDYRLVLADSEKYRAIDWVVTEGTQRRVYLGIDELDGDTWRFCANMSQDNPVRPTKLEPSKDVYFYVFKRVEGK
jgi:uncharacterized protein (TIGR03067 family)